MKNTIAQAAWQNYHGPIELEKILRQTRDWANSRGEARRSLRTLDGTAKSIWSEQMPVSCVWELEFSILAYATDASVARYYGSRTLRRGSSGAAVVLATNNARAADYEDVAGWNYAVTLSADGTVSIDVTGDATRTVDWICCTSIIEAP